MRSDLRLNSVLSLVLLPLKPVLRLLFIAVLLGLKAPPAGAVDGWKSSMNPEISLEEQGYFQNQSPDKATPRILMGTKIPASVRYGRTWKFRALPTLGADPQNVSTEERYYWDFPEAYVQWQQLPLTMQAGLNTYTWGATDGFNPLDVVNPHRYFDPLRSEKIGSPSVLLKRDFESGVMEFIYIPKQRKTSLPGENSRWLPRQIYINDTVATSFGVARIISPTEFRYHYMDANELNQALSHNFGFHVKKQFPGLDLSLVGYQGAASTPVVAVAALSVVLTSFTTNTLTVNPDIYLRASYYKTRMLGASAVLALGDFLVKGESAYTQPVSQRNDISKHNSENVLGIERMLGVGAGSLTILAQGTYCDRKDPFDNNSTSLSRMFDRAAMLGLRWAPTEKFTWMLTGLYDSKYKGDLVHSDANYTLSDTVKVTAGADILGGIAGTPLGTYRKNSRGMMGLVAHW